MERWAAWVSVKEFSKNGETARKALSFLSRWRRQIIFRIIKCDIAARMSAKFTIDLFCCGLVYVVGNHKTRQAQH